MSDEPQPDLPRDLLPDEVEFAVLDLLVLPRAARDAGIERLCTDHPTLAGSIRALARLGALDVQAEAMPARIGPFDVLRKIGEGGMGIVYLAEQHEPVRRRVAVKVLKLGMDSRRVLARFELERQTLALMEHSNIAKVFDGGLTEDGRPYFAMEFVEGEPITEFAERRGLGVDARLALFRQVCLGVQHAHQKGVIHRDLKPSNVLVTVEDGEPRPRIIDFGLARATERQDALRSLQTLEGQIVGTPAYMSPEQIDPDVVDVDTRSDVYSLGVVLYELLVGELPFDGGRLREAGLVGMQRVVLEDPPPRPSSRVSRTVQGSSVDRSSWGRTLRGDLDRILLKTLEKEPDRRYASPGDLADDLRRFLDHEPVEARAPSLGYRIRKFVRKHRVAVTAAAVVAAALLTATVTSSLALREAERSLGDFERLSVAVLLEQARAREPALDPAWPDQEAAIRSWLADAAEITGKLPALRAAVEGLRARALPWSPEDREADRQGQAAFEDHQKALSELRSLQYADEIRLGMRSFEPFELPASTQPRSAEIAGRRATSLTGPYATIRGREAEGLALARLSVELGRAAGRVPVAAGTTLAFACWSNGLHDEARAAIAAAEERAPSAGARRFVGEQRDSLEWWIEWSVRGGAMHRMLELEHEVAALGASLDQRHTWRFVRESDRFLHETLTRSIAEIESFEREEVPRTRARLAWARSLRERSIERHAARWRAAREALAAADGERASERYGVRPIDLPPQIGLVPIGMNPVTKLWEFYDLRSAADPEAIPTHGPDGGIDVGEGTGLVFVLIPEQELFIGEQSRNPDWPLYDPLAPASEDMTIEQVAVLPFLMSRFEMTKGQWERLSRAADGGRFRPGFREGEGMYAVDLSYPVENVSWLDCDRVLRRDRLMIPTEAQWEAACRGGTTTSWSTGREVASLQGFVNLADVTASRSDVRFLVESSLDDGFFRLAPVGSFLPNPFGLHDVHGNVEEWTRERYMNIAASPVLLPDSRRILGRHDRPEMDGIYRAARGGSYRSVAAQVRSAFRKAFEQGYRSGEIGVRPARRISWE